MAYVQLPEGLPGIVGLFERYRETARPMRELAQLLLRSDSGLSPAEREVIATYVSSLNACPFCARSHGAAAAHLPGGRWEAVAAVAAGSIEGAAISEKLRALLRIARKVTQSGSAVTSEDVARAREQGAGDREIHDTVLIAAAFCMYNRYVDGLATWAPEDAAAYEAMGERLAKEGYA